MRRTAAVCVFALMVLGLPALNAGPAAASVGSSDPRSAPPDRAHPSHPARAQDYLHGRDHGLSGSGFVRDVGVSGTEPSIAVDPTNPNRVVVASGFGGWNGNASLSVSADGGNTFTSYASVPPPPNGIATNGCPCDQTIEFGRDGTMYGTFLSFGGAGNPNAVYSGSTTDPTSPAAWSWFTTASPATAQQTSFNTSGATSNVDQPWLTVGRDPTTAAQDDVYVAYDDFNGSPTMRVSAATGSQPPNFVRDTTSGAAGGAINPGHRLTTDPSTGYLYSLWQDSPGGGAGSSKQINYHLNRSVDAGLTWTLNGSTTGVTVATADSDQPTKFGTVNALLGGVDSAAVDPNTGDVYYVYGNRDAGTGQNRLSVARLQGNAAGTQMNVASTSFLTGQVQAALPSIAVATNGTVGVLYDSFDGFSSSGLPIFSAHFSLSSDRGATFTDRVLETFLSPNKDNANGRQRNLGDYQQVKALGRTFFGVYSGNPVPLGSSTSKIDPIFFKASAGGPVIATSGSLDFGTVARGSSATRDLTVQNTGDQDLLVNGVTMAAGSAPAYSVLTNPGVPQTIPPGGSVVFTVRFAPAASSSSGTSAGTVVIDSSDPITPTTKVQATGRVGVPVAVLSPGPLSFPATCAGASTDLTETVSNSGAADLTITGATLSGLDSSQFSVVNAPPPPVVVPPGSSYGVVVRFSPTSGGPKTALLTITTDDPSTPVLTADLSGGGTTAHLVLGSATLGFGGVPVDDRTSPSTASQVLSVFNQSDCALTLSNLAASGDVALLSPPATPVTVSAHNQLDLTVVFDPTAAGSRTGQVTIASSDPALPVATVGATGTGLVPVVGVSTNRLVFGPTVIEPAAAGLGGATQDVRVTNTGQAELIVDSITTTGAPFGAPPAASPPARYATTSGFPLPVTFHPSGGSTPLTYTGSVTVADENLAAPVSRTVDLCGEAVGRGVRVRVVNASGTPYSQLSKLMLTSHGVTQPTSINLKNLGLVTRTTCQQVKYQYDNEALPATDTTNQRGSYYSLSVSVGNKSTNVVFTLGVAQFQNLTVTVG